MPAISPPTPQRISERFAPPHLGRDSPKEENSFEPFPEDAEEGEKKKGPVLSRVEKLAYTSGKLSGEFLPVVVHPDHHRGQEKGREKEDENVQLVSQGAREGGDKIPGTRKDPSAEKKGRRHPPDHIFSVSRPLRLPDGGEEDPHQEGGLEGLSHDDEKGFHYFPP